MNTINDIIDELGFSRPTIRRLIKEKKISKVNNNYIVHIPENGHFVTLKKACQLNHYSKEGIRHKSKTKQIDTIKLNQRLFLYDISSLENRVKTPKNKHYLRVSESAYLLKIKESNIRYYAKKGELPFVFDENQHRRFDIDVLEAFFKNKTKKRHR